MCLEIFREIIREVRQYKVQKLLVLASNSVVEMLLDEEADMLAELETFLGVQIKFRAEAEYNQEQYDVVLLWNRIASRLLGMIAVKKPLWFIMSRVRLDI